MVEIRKWIRYNKYIIAISIEKGVIGVTTEKDFLRKKAEEKKMTSFSVRVPVDIKTQLEVRSEEAGFKSVASLCRLIFEIYLENEDEILMLADGKAKIVPIEE